MSDRGDGGPDEMAAVLEPLEEEQRTAVRLRFGLDGAEPRTYAEVGRLLDLPAEVVSERVAGALAKLRARTAVDGPA